MMRVLLIAGLTAVLAGCGADDPSSQLSEIEELRAKNIPLTATQQAEVEASIAEGKRLLADGNQAESSEHLEKALKVLNRAADADRFNKSE